MLNINLNEKYKKKVLENILLTSCVKNHAQLIKNNEGKKYDYSCSNCNQLLVKGESETTRKTKKGKVGREEPFCLPEKKIEEYGLEMEPGVNILVDYVVKRAIKVALVQVLYNQDHLALVMHIVLVR